MVRTFVIPSVATGFTVVGGAEGDCDEDVEGDIEGDVEEGAEGEADGDGVADRVDAGELVDEQAATRASNARDLRTHALCPSKPRPAHCRHAASARFQ
jgi:hypothetical protein